MKTLNKASLRQTLRKMRKNLPEKQRIEAEKKVCVLLSPWIKRNSKIGVYWAVGSELSLKSLIARAQKRGAKIYLPYIEKGKRRLWFTEYPKTQQKIECKRFNIPQFAGKKIRAHQLQTLLVPLVGVDVNGFRLGQGGGFYDTSLAHCRHRLQPQIVGVGFACQITENVYPEKHDSRLQYFVCEKGVRSFHHEANN